MSLIRKYVAVLQAWACLALVLLSTNLARRFNRHLTSLSMRTVADSHKSSCYLSYKDDLSGGTKIETLNYLEIQKWRGFSEFFAISGCDEYLKMNFRRNYWRQSKTTDKLN